MASPPGRGNGLHAATYAPLTDLDPHVADLVLGLLRDAGIAAYAAPATERSPGQLVLPRVDRVLDRVYVDAREALRARSLVDGHLHDLDAEEQPAHAAAERADDDAAWAQIVAAYNLPAVEPVRRWRGRVGDPGDVRPGDVDGGDVDGGDVDRGHPGPADPGPAGVDSDGASRGDTGPGDGPGDGAAPGGTSRRDGPGDGAGRGEAPRHDEPRGAGHGPGRGGRLLRRAGDRAEEPDDDWTSPPREEAGPRRDPDEDHYVPPPPPPLPRGDTISRWAWAGLLGAPLFFFLTTLLGVRLDDWVVLLGAGAFVGGFVTLVARMKERPSNGSGPDDGAVV